MSWPLQLHRVSQRRLPIAADHWIHHCDGLRRQRRILLSTRPSRHSQQTTSPAPSSWSSSVSSLFSELRMSAASALTASLPEQERHRLLQTYQTNEEGRYAESLSAAADEKEQEEWNKASESTLTVAEKVSHKQLEDELHKLQASHAVELERVKADVEKATEQRVQQELAILQARQQGFARWQQQVAQEKRLQAAAQATVPAVPSAAPAAVEAAEDAPSLREHPVLGRCLFNDGRKQVYQVAADVLANIPTWQEQRTFRHDRVRDMAADKAKTLHLGWPGIIGLHQDGNGQLRILDGQHRVGMWKTLLDQNLLKAAPQVLVEVYYLDQLDDDKLVTRHARDLFTEINKAEPVQYVDLPGVAKAGDRKTLEGVTLLAAKFPAMFSHSTRCRKPHLHIDNTRNAIYQANALERHGIKTSKALLAWLEAQNDALKSKYHHDKELQLTLPKGAWSKAVDNDFYLGLDSTWYTQ